MINIEKLLESKRVEVTFIDVEVNKEFVKEFRQNHHLTQVALANVLGVTKKTIEKWEQGTSKIGGSSAVLLKLLSENPELLSQLYHVKVGVTREILFRGKRKDNDEWEYGYYVHQYGKHIIAQSHEILLETYEGEYGSDHYHVDPATVGQYTGLTDGTKWEQLTKEEQTDWLRNHTAEEWNGKKIFEGDIVKHDFGEEQIGVQYAVVEYSDKYAAFMIKPLHDWMYCGKSDCEVIGNIHDNKLEVELLCNGEVNYGG